MNVRRIALIAIALLAFINPVSKLFSSQREPYIALQESMAEIDNQLEQLPQDNPSVISLKARAYELSTQLAQKEAEPVLTWKDWVPPIFILLFLIPYSLPNRVAEL